MKKGLTTCFLATATMTLLAFQSVSLAQEPFGIHDTVLVGGGAKSHAGITTTLNSPVQSINLTGNYAALVVPVGFPDKSATLQFPQLVNSQYFPVLGVDSNGTLLSDLITENGGALPEDEWYGPAFNSYFTKESGGLFNVDFTFVKKPDGTRYTTTDDFSYFQGLNGGSDNGVVADEYQYILNEVAQNMVAENPNVFNGVKQISFTFEGLALNEFYGGDVEGFTPPGTTTLYGANNQVLWSGPVTLQMDCTRIIHEFMHAIGVVAGYPPTGDPSTGFHGFPDRGYDPSVYDSSPGNGNSYHGNMGFDYDIMDHNSALVSLHSLYGLRPITSHDLIFLGWIKPNEILNIDSSNYVDYRTIKLADVNVPLTQQQVSDGFYRIVKVMIHKNYDGQGHDEYFLVEYHDASEFDKTFENYDDYQNGGYNTGVLIWHVKELVNMINDYPSNPIDNLVELEPAVPYNDWHGIPTPNDSYPGHASYNRPPLRSLGYPWWNGIYSADFNYLDDDRFSGSDYVYFPDGGRHIWETKLSTDPGWTGWNSIEQPGTIVLAREQSMRSDFFSDSPVKGYVTNAMTDVTRPSTKDWGSYNNGAPVSNQTHIAIANISRQNGYMTLNVYYNTISGSVTQNTTFTQNTVIAGNLTLSSGVALTVAPGPTLTLLTGDTLLFGSGAGLVVGGILNAIGTSSSPIVFSCTGSTSPGSWGSVVITGGEASNSTMKYVDMSYGTGVSVSNCSGVTIENCTFSANSSGVIFTNTQGDLLVDNTIPFFESGDAVVIQQSATVFCIGNTIYSNGGYQNTGIWFYQGGGGTLSGNDIDHFFFGVDMSEGASPYFRNYPNTYSVNNRFADNAEGLVINQDSYPTMFDNSSSFGTNSIYGNTIADIELDQETYSMKAYYNYWNGGNPSNAKLILGSGCAVEDGLFITTNYWAQTPIPSVQSGTMGSPSIVSGAERSPLMADTPGGIQTSPPVVTDSGTADPLFDGIKYRDEGNFSQAAGFFMSYLTKHPDDQQAYAELFNCADSETTPGLIQFFKALPNQASKEQQLLLALLYERQGDIQPAVQVDDQIIQTSPNAGLAFSAEMNKFLVALYGENNPQLASTLLDTLSGTQDTSVSRQLALARTELQTYVDPSTGKMPFAAGAIRSSSMKAQVAASQLPKTFGLSQNYQNPFNHSGLNSPPLAAKFRHE